MSKTFQSVPPCSSNKSQVPRVSGEFGLKTKIMVLFLVLLVTTHSLPIVFGAPDDPTSPNTQSMVLSNLREAAESRRDELFYLFEEEVPSEILAQLQGAITQMNLASTLEDDDPYGAAQAYLDALKLFRGSWESYSDYKPAAGEESLVNVIEDLTQEPQPQNIDEEIKNNKEKRIIKFQEKILKGIEEEENSELDMGTPVFETIKSGLEHLKRMIQEGSLTSAVEVLKVTAYQYRNSVDDLSSKQSSKLEKSLTNIESKLEREEEKESTKNGKEIGVVDEEKTNNGNGKSTDVTEKTNNGKDDENKNNGNSESETVDNSNNNGNGHGKDETDTPPDTSDDKTNNGKGNTKTESTETEETPDPEPVEEKTNNGNGNGNSGSNATESDEQPEPEEKSNNGNGNSKQDEETRGRSSTNDPGSNETPDDDEPEAKGSPKKDKQDKSNNHKKQ